MEQTPEPTKGPSVAAISRRVAIGGIGAAAVGYAILGPKPRRSGGVDRIRLDYWEKWTGHEAAAMQAVVDLFNTSQDRIFVNYLTVGGIILQ